MKSLFALLVLLCVTARANTAAAAPAIPAQKISQEEAGKRLIHEILYGDSVSIAPYFEDSVATSLTKQTLGAIQGQINWLSRMIGDSLEQLTSGTHTDTAHHETSFFREYRLANESNKRSPMLVVHLWFKDSVTNQAAGAFVKNFLENSEKKLDGEHTWEVEGKNVDINSIVLITFEPGSMLAIKVYDDDTTALDSLVSRRKAVPIIRKAIAEGWMEKAKAELHGGTLLPDAGVAFIRMDPRYGYTQYKYGVLARYFTEKPGPVTAPPGKPQTKKKGAKVK